MTDQCTMYTTGKDLIPEFPKVPHITVGIITNVGIRGNEFRKLYLDRLLKSIQLASFPKTSIEILIAGAVDGLITQARLINLPTLAASGQVSALRNKIIEVAQGAILIQVDDDILFTERYWDSVSSQLSHDWDILCTRILNPNGTRYWDWAAFYPGKGLTLLPYNVNDPYVYATGGHAIYRRHVFEKIRWNEDLRHGDNEEFDLADQARSAGLKFSLCENAKIFLQYHHCDATAVIAQRSQHEPESECHEFIQTVRKVNQIKPDTIQNELSGQLLKKIEHKIQPSSHPKVSILVACNRYLQRFRIFAQTIMKQDFDLRKIEVVIANPHSPDGLSTHIRVIQSALNETGPVFKEALVDKAHYRNRGYLIQRAFEMSSGDVVIGMDCDLVLPPWFLTSLAPLVLNDKQHLFGVYRRFLTPETTNQILAGLLDPMDDLEAFQFEDQQEDQGYRGVLGYCQALHRESWSKVGYPEEFDNIAKSDVAFVERLAKHGINPRFLENLWVLHLHHQRNWEGTDDYL